MIEVLTVLIIIGVLAAIVIPEFTAYRLRGYNVAAKSSLRNAFTFSQAYFADNPSGTITSVADLSPYGFRPTPGVTLSITGDIASLSGTARYNAPGTTQYAISATGLILP